MAFLPVWFGRVDASGNLHNSTLFSGVLMMIIAALVPFEYLNDMISAGVLVAFSMTDSSLILLRHESPDDSPGLLEGLVASFNALVFLSGLLISHAYASPLGKSLTLMSCFTALLVCCLIWRWCPPVQYFGGKTRVTTQHMTIGVVSVKDEEFRAPLLPFLPCLGIFVN